MTKQSEDLQHALAFILRIHDLCAQHIEGRKEIERRVCGDCPVRKLRAQAEQFLRRETEPKAKPGKGR